MRSVGSSFRDRKRSNASSDMSHASDTGQTLKSSACDRDFEQKCIDHGVSMPGEGLKPDNSQELQQILARPRSSPSPSRLSHGEVKKFGKIRKGVRDDADVLRESFPTSPGSNRLDCLSGDDVLFGNMDNIAPDILEEAKPDIYGGAQPAQIDRRVGQALSPQLVPSTDHSYPVAPNLFLEAEGSGGSAAVKRRQECYNGALGARAMRTLQSYGQETVL